ncbi:uncharacterized protein LOC127848216 isoform X4 [Dreissena polymorpha]|uniref:uncharacterized protein LOC127848216 isoform X4 n=1 Tax=Dreissena polymorpha TaxID=45954 RepID=UPI002264E83D|nr:uncharacterized protein LOC127848216 isoform X4 [Dreissena polymorpha]
MYKLTMENIKFMFRYFSLWMYYAAGQRIMCNNIPTTWTDAMSRCQMVGGSQVIPDSVHGPFIQSAKNSSFWIGRIISRELSTNARESNIEECIKTGTYLQASSCQQTYVQTRPWYFPKGSYWVRSNYSYTVRDSSEQRFGSETHEELFKCGRINGMDLNITFDNCSNMLPSLCVVSSSYIVNTTSEYTECIHVWTTVTETNVTRPPNTSEKTTNTADLIKRFSWITQSTTYTSRSHGIDTTLPPSASTVAYSTFASYKPPKTQSALSSVITVGFTTIRSSKSTLTLSKSSSEFNDSVGIITIAPNKPFEASTTKSALAIGLSIGIVTVVISGITLACILLRRKADHRSEEHELSEVHGRRDRTIERTSDFVGGSEEIGSESVRFSSDNAQFSICCLFEGC